MEEEKTKHLVIVILIIWVVVIGSLIFFTDYNIYVISGGFLVSLFVFCFLFYFIGKMNGKYFEIFTIDFIDSLELFASEISSDLSKAGIKHTTACGNLLGIARYNTFTVWDDDSDIFIRNDDVEKFLEFVKSDQKYTVNKTSFGFALKSKKNSCFWMDIFVLYNKCGDMLKYKGHSDNSKDFLYIDEWENGIKEISFGVSGRPEKKISALHGDYLNNYLTRFIGSNWATHAVVKLLHKHTWYSLSYIFS